MATSVNVVHAELGELAQAEPILLAWGPRRGDSGAATSFINSGIDRAKDKRTKKYAKAGLNKLPKTGSEQYVPGTIEVKLSIF